MPKAARKSLYIFLSSLMGALLFLILQRILASFYWLALSYDYSSWSFGLTYVQLLAMDYTFLLLAVFLGTWYGIWVGIFWYEGIYERKQHFGFTHHLIKNYWPVQEPAYNLRERVAKTAQKVEKELWELEDLAKQIPDRPAPRKRVVRRKAA